MQNYHYQDMLVFPRSEAVLETQGTNTLVGFPPLAHGKKQTLLSQRLSHNFVNIFYLLI